jgi:hypothetical protein
MLLDSIFQPFVDARPVAVMARAAMERILDSERIDRVFHDNATQQYEQI